MSTSTTDTILEKAKQLFEEALAETGIDKVSLTMIYNDSGVQVTTSESAAELAEGSGRR